jgi:hypothetical protein
MCVQQATLWLHPQVWWLFCVPASIVLTALAHAFAEKIRSRTRNNCDEDLDQSLKKRGVEARKRSQFALDAARRERNLGDPP